MGPAYHFLWIPCHVLASPWKLPLKKVFPSISSMIFRGHDTEEGHDFEYPESSSPYGNVISLVRGGWFSGGFIFMMCFF